MIDKENENCYKSDFYQNQINKICMHKCANVLLTNLNSCICIVNQMGLIRQEHDDEKADKRMFIIPEIKWYDILFTALKKLTSSNIDWVTECKQWNSASKNVIDYCVGKKEQSELNPLAKEVIERLAFYLYDLNNKAYFFQKGDGIGKVSLLTAEEKSEIIECAMYRCKNKEIKWKKPEGFRGVFDIKY